MIAVAKSLQPSRLDDRTLLALLRSEGKPRQAAVTQLYARYGRDFKGYFRRHGAGEAQAEDLLQDTFVKVIRAIDGYEGSGTLEAWLWAIARNTLISQLRGRGKEPSVSLDAEVGEEDGATAWRERLAGFDSNPADADCVKRGLAAFTAKFAEYAHVLERLVVDDWGYDELAAYRGCSAGAAREYLSQCRKKLWQFVGHCYSPGAE